MAASVNLIQSLATADDTHSTATANSVVNGCKIYRIWLELWAYGQTAGATNDIIDIYLMKNPGNNLTPPNPGTVGTSNEKKFVFKTWKGLMGVKSLGGTPYAWKGWIKIPKVYQRMGTDDRLVLIARSPTIGDFCFSCTYKWFR